MIVGENRIVKLRRRSYRRILKMLAGERKECWNACSVTVASLPKPTVFKGGLRRRQLAGRDP